MGYCVEHLPDIQIVGGDTTPIEIYIARNNGAQHTIESLGAYTASLTLALPYYSSSSLDQLVVLQKAGEVRYSSENVPCIAFDFEYADTSDLCGKYIYQVEVKTGDQVIVKQGTIHIKKNANN